MAEVPRLFLITPKLADGAAIRPLLEAAMAAADIACVLFRTASSDESTLKALFRTAAPAVQERGGAALVESEGRIAARLGADGVHVGATGPALEEALAALKPDRIVGVGGLGDRDEAMMAGEAGADYLMFGFPDGGGTTDEVVARVEWWSQIFNVPCVGYADHPDRAADIAAAGAEFVALGENLWGTPSEVTARLRGVDLAIRARLAEAVR